MLNPRTATKYQSRGEVFTEKSLTVPGQIEPMRKILNAIVAGKQPAIRKNIYHDGKENFDDFDDTLRPNFDFTDIDNISNEMQERKAAQKAKQDEEDAAEQAKLAAEAEEFNQWKASRTSEAPAEP